MYRLSAIVPDSYPEEITVYVVYTYVRRPRSTRPIRKVLSIETSPSRAQRLAREWTERQQRRYNNSIAPVENERYQRHREARDGECVMWSTPQPYRDDYVFHAWTCRQTMEVHDITCVWEEESEFSRLLRLIGL